MDKKSFISNKSLFMYTDPHQSNFSKSILTGLFAGLVATMTCFIFEIIYRFATGYEPSEFINVSSIIFIVNLLMLAAGIIYFVFKKLFKRGDLLFILLSTLITGFCIWKAEVFHRFPNIRLSREFSDLLSGTVLIIGVCCISIPLIFNNKRMNEFVI